jgi:hypothetical protein
VEIIGYAGCYLTTCFGDAFVKNCDISPDHFGLNDMAMWEDSVFFVEGRDVKDEVVSDFESQAPTDVMIQSAARCPSLIAL